MVKWQVQLLDDHYAKMQDVPEESNELLIKELALQYCISNFQLRHNNILIRPSDVSNYT